LQPTDAVVDIVVDFADKFFRLEAENVKLRKAAKSSVDQVQEANRLAAEARNKSASLKEELKKLKKKMKEEQESRLKAFVEADNKDGALRKSIESLLSKIFLVLIYLFSLRIFCRCSEFSSMIL
jgi:predicted  nucleic acid-binding Zn-ribbon protein